MGHGPRVLITNDDGIASPGLLALARAAVRDGFDVVVAAPHKEASGAGAGLTVVAESGREVVREEHLPDLPDIPCFSVSSHPAFIVLSALEGTFGDPPELVLSGVNRGLNVGRAVIHSGTVGAVLTAAVNGIRGMAVSLTVTDPEFARWASVDPVIHTALPLIRRAPAGSVLNVNIPDGDVAELGPLTRATLSNAGAVQTRLKQRDGQEEVLSTFVGGKAEPGTDAYLLDRGFPTITALQPVSVAAEPELPERVPLRAVAGEGNSAQQEGSQCVSGTP
ncbi:5'-nucleotidase [Amycolatopsis marina]|uniref:5'-nucleotidase n=1 Tax=Amycolatopsis marina TaxID=490629 RepID=A0A1I1CA76_9PSEU|nr:5'/3'-nucleotidase SurE [Amycolatopsis marina]SFB59002.1 5'-nucleotidase [Amycolatopsis marina]